MLTVAKVTGQHAVGYGDYLQGKTTAPELGDYYLKDGERVEAAGRWVAGADRVDSHAGEVVGDEALRELMAVRHPTTGEPLRRTGGDGTAVAAIDATFSAPKSVSAVWALADSDLRSHIETAHEQAINEAIGYARDRVAMIRERVGSTVIHAHATDLIATAWRHTTARAVGGQAPDPQLHSHVLLHAAARRDGELVAIDSRAWLIHRRELGAAYRTHLAHQLGQLGFEIQRHTGRGGRYFEIVGVPQLLIDRWSSRHHQVKEAIENRLAQKEAELHAVINRGGPDAEAAQKRLTTLEKSRTLSAAENRLAGLSTRAAKAPTTIRDLDRDWARIATRAGFTRRDVERQRVAGREEVLAVSPQVLLPALTELHATFTDREARAIALEQSAGASIDDALAVLTRARAGGEVLALADDRITTRAQRAAEQQTLAAAERIALDAAQPIDPIIVDVEIHRLESNLAAEGSIITDEQRDAIHTACGEGRLVVIDGQAGTGKSTVLRAIARAHQRAGQEIVVTSTSALAAQRLGHELAAAGVDCVDYSTVGLTLAARNKTLDLGPDTTIIHDEAALASTRELQPLTDLIESSGGRLILVGDPHQSQPVGSGGLWLHFEQIATDTDARAQLTHNVRARDSADRHDQARFRAGEHEAALRGYHDRGRLHAASEPAAAENAALDAAHTDRNAGRRTVVVTQTSNDHLDALNARAQSLRIADGELGEKTLDLRGRPYQLRTGDDIQLRRTIHHRDLGPLRNGTHATVAAVDPQGKSAGLLLDDGREISLTKTQLDTARARLAYVQHPFPAQGITTDTAHLIIGDHVSQHGTYVGLTRAREQTDIYHAKRPPQAAHEDDLIAELAQHAGRGEIDRPSIAYATLKPAPRRSRPVEDDMSVDPSRASSMRGLELDPSQLSDRRAAPQQIRVRTQEHDEGWEW